MKKSIELVEPGSEIKSESTMRWLQILAPFALSVVVGAMLGAMLGAMSYSNSVDATSGDGKYLVAQLTGLFIGLVVGIVWSRQVALAGPPEDTVMIGMSMLRKYHRNHAKSGEDADAAQYKLGNEYLRSLASGK
jgi:hypothetical protein